jgi:transposase
VDNSGSWGFVVPRGGSPCLISALSSVPSRSTGFRGRTWPRGGNRRLNHAIHMAALTQLRNPGPGRDYYLPKLAEKKKPKAALRCLKRQISDAIYRQILADARAMEGGPGRALGGDYEDQRGQPNPDGRLFDQATARAPTAGYARRRTSVLTTEGCHSVRPAAGHGDRPGCRAALSTQARGLTCRSPLEES